MNYRSTRDPQAQPVTSAAAIIKGLAPDGGLFVPSTFPQPSYDLAPFTTQPYQAIAQQVLTWFFPDLAALPGAVQRAYGTQWDAQQITPLSARHGGNYYLELFHGPTLAFKDVALQALPQLLQLAKVQTGEDSETIILTATSGDTGTAALRGFQNVAGTQVIVFYPRDGISPVQKAQMLGQAGANLHVVAVTGNFDQAQTTVKQLFSDHALAHKLAARQQQFSSANSMNVGRLIPQIAYYFAAYGQLLQRQEIQSGDLVNFAVPTGNFGDILAGYYAKKLGLPVGKLICASNANNVLTDFFTTGTYDKRREFYVTNSPSLDILVSSNLERLLFDVSDHDADLVAQLMNQLQTTGHYTVPAEVHQRLTTTFAAGYATPMQLQAEIKRVFDADNYLIDPHTAVGSFVARQYQQVTGDQRPCVVLATASPYKFPETVLDAISPAPVSSGLTAIKQLAEFDAAPLTAGVQELFTNQPQSQAEVAPADMKAIVQQILQG